MSNVHQSLSDVKEFDEKTFYFLRFLLQDEAQHIIADSFPELRKKNFCRCHKRVLTPSASAQVYLNTDTRRAYWHRVATCANSMLCPVCAPRIASYRCKEISSAVMQHLSSDPDNRLYFLTLTCRHCSTDQIGSLLPAFSKAQTYFYGLRSVQNYFNSFDALPHITAREVTYSLQSGVHPHSHNLHFGRVTSSLDIDELNRLWLYCLKKYGLDGLSGIALTLQPADDLRTYLTKISQEMVLQHVKSGRATGHFTPMQLLNEAACGHSWARKAFADIFAAYAGKHLLYWSRGLKARFGINEVSEEQIVNNSADAERLIAVLEVPRKIFNSFSHFKRAEILSDVSRGDYSRLRNFLMQDFCHKK